MGFEPRRNGGRFVNIKKGQFSYKEGDHTVLTDDALKGHLIGLDIVDDEYQGDKFKKLCLTLDDGNEKWQLQMKMGSGYANAFCCAIRNADLSQPISFSAKYEEINEKPKTSLFLSQNGKALKWYYTKDNPGDLPLVERVEFRGKIMWDNMAQQEYLMNMLNTVIKPQLVHSVLAGPSTQTGQPSGWSSATPTQTGGTGSVEPIDDLPF